MYPYKIFGDFDLYTILITLGICVCLLLFRLLSDRLHFSARLCNLSLGAGVFGIAVGFGTAVLFQAFYDFLDGDGFYLDAFTGATFYGGLLGGAAAFLLCYFLAGRFWLPDSSHKTAFFAVTSAVSAAISLAHAFGRLGCLCVGCCHGVVTDSPLGVYMPAVGDTVFPTQLYESLFLFALCATLVFRTLRGHTDGLPLYLIAYGTFRYFLEFLRGDDRGASPLPFLTPSQFTAVLLVTLGVGIYLFRGRKKPISFEK